MARVLLRCLLVALVLYRGEAFEPDYSCVSGAGAPTKESVGLETVADEISIPPSVCQEIIDVADKHGYSTDADSIDGRAVLDINVFNHGRVLNDEIHSLLAPYLPAMKAALDKRFLGG